MLNIIHETKDIIIVNKPAGQLSQGAKGFDLDLVSEVMTYNASQGKPAYAAIINRLDRPVSGLLQRISLQQQSIPHLCRRKADLINNMKL